MTGEKIYIKGIEIARKDSVIEKDNIKTINNQEIIGNGNISIEPKTVAISYFDFNTLQGTGYTNIPVCLNNVLLSNYIDNDYIENIDGVWKIKEPGYYKIDISFSTDLNIYKNLNLVVSNKVLYNENDDIISYSIDCNSVETRTFLLKVEINDYAFISFSSSDGASPKGIASLTKIK